MTTYSFRAGCHADAEAFQALIPVSTNVERWQALAEDDYFKQGPSEHRLHAIGAAGSPHTADLLNQLIRFQQPRNFETLWGLATRRRGRQSFWDSMSTSQRQKFGGERAKLGDWAQELWLIAARNGEFCSPDVDGERVRSRSSLNRNAS